MYLSNFPWLLLKLVPETLLRDFRVGRSRVSVEGDLGVQVDAGLVGVHDQCFLQEVSDNKRVTTCGQEGQMRVPREVLKKTQ